MGRDPDSGAVAPSRDEYRGGKTRDGSFCNCGDGLSFFSGLCIERNLKSGKTLSTRKIESFMTALRNL
jgi:hypothetical protein